jgi:putative ATP-binding cassette transporter
LTNAALIALTNRFLTGAGKLPAGAGWVFLGLCVILPGSRFLSRALLIRETQSSLTELRLLLCRRILSSPLRRVEQLGAVHLQATLINDLVRITDALAAVPELVLYSVLVVGCLIYLGWLSWPLLLALLAVLAVGVATYQLPMKRAIRYQRLAREQWDEVLEDVRGVTLGTKELKMHELRRESFLTTRLRTSSTTLQRYIVRSGTLFTAATSWGQVLFFLLVGALLFVLPTWRTFSSELIVGYVIVTVYMMNPLDFILSVLPTLSNAEVSVRNIEELGLSLTEEPAEAEAAAVLGTAPWHSLELVAVTHSYRREGENESFELGPIDLSFRPGEMVFLIGGNGSGKTTLAKILLGLYAPDAGELRLDGVPVGIANRDAYRQRFSVVFADYFLFAHLFGIEAAGQDERSLHYLRRLHLQNEVRVLDGALSTLDLSQGQRKRLALFTAYLEDRPIYLFDEWASDQDPLFKEAFYRELLPELKARGKTVFVISHDDRYYGVADRIVKLADGAVEYDGPAENILAAAASFAGAGAAGERHRVER